MPEFIHWWVLKEMPDLKAVHRRAVIIIYLLQLWVGIKMGG